MPKLSENEKRERAAAETSRTPLRDVGEWVLLGTAVEAISELGFHVQGPGFLALACAIFQVPPPSRLFGSKKR